MSAIEDAQKEAHRRQHRRALGLPLHPTADELAAEAAKRAKEEDSRLEREIQADCVKEYRAAGCDVYVLAQKKAHKMTPGIPDLLVFPPGFAGQAFWHEVKTPTGEQRPDQKVFQENCERTGTVYVLGGVAAAIAEIARRGLRSMDS